MKLRVKDETYDVGNIFDSPITLLMELHQLTGMEGQDIMDGLRQTEGQVPGQKTLMALAAIVWLGKRRAGIDVGFEEAVAGLALDDIDLLPDPVPTGAQLVEAVEAATDPSQPGSGPAAPVLVAAPVPGTSGLLPGVTSLTPLPPSSLPSTTFGPA